MSEPCGYPAGDCVRPMTASDIVIRQLEAELASLKRLSREGVQKLIDMPPHEFEKDKLREEIQSLKLQVESLRSVILTGAPPCPEDDPCTCMRCRLKAVVA